ncbi:hypothetical protein [Vibrio lentus]|uniref:hypothetical protein n=1 Tax=Vibrio lentus TaxID=136468 RepID=UPI0012FFEDA5|nr:hypothetical protein [Vibrio lentus]
MTHLCPTLSQHVVTTLVALHDLYNWKLVGFVGKAENKERQSRINGVTNNF